MACPALPTNQSFSFLPEFQALLRAPLAVDTSPSLTFYIPPIRKHSGVLTWQAASITATDVEG